jgi:hypothetical protein
MLIELHTTSLWMLRASRCLRAGKFAASEDDGLNGRLAATTRQAGNGKGLQMHSSTNSALLRLPSIAAGAAIGFVAAATAAAWAGSPPAPGYCWYHTDPSRTQGFWDVCP